jgi:outer membrane protein
MMMTTRNFLTVCAMLATASVTDAAAREWTLDECIDYAIANNLTVKQRELDRISAEQNVTAAKDAFLPNVSASAQESWSFGRGLTSENTYANRNTSNLGWSVGLNLPLFQGLQNVRQVAYAKSSLVATVEALEGAKDDITLQVIAQYLQVLYYGEILDVAKSQEELTATELEQQQALFDAGKIAEANLLDAKSQWAQAHLQVVQADSDRALALLDLSQLLRLSSDDEFAVTPIADVDPTLLNPEYVYNQALSTNHTIAAQRAQIDAAGRQIKVAESGWLPTLSFNAGLTSNYYTVSGYESAGFGSQMRENFSKYVGFSLAVPLFDAFSTRNSVRRAKVQQQSAQLTYQSNIDELYKAIQQAYRQAVNARERYQAAEVATTSAQAALDAAQEKYSLGRATATDFDTARNTYFKAASERTQAKYELLLRARILNFYANR